MNLEGLRKKRSIAHKHRARTTQGNRQSSNPSLIRCSDGVCDRLPSPPDIRLGRRGLLIGDNWPEALRLLPSWLSSFITAVNSSSGTSGRANGDFRGRSWCCLKEASESSDLRRRPRKLVMLSMVLAELGFSGDLSVPPLSRKRC